MAIVEAHTKFDIDHAFVATSGDLEKLWSLLAMDGGMEVTAKASCADGLVRHFSTVDGLSHYENAQRAAIASMEISGRVHEPYRTAEISLGARYGSPVSVSIRGEENLVLSLRMAISDIVSGMKPWYSRISTFDLFVVWFSIFVVLFGLLQTMTPSNAPAPGLPFPKAVGVMIVGIGLMGLIIALVSGVSSLRKRIFPVVTFAIGQGMARHTHLEQFRWVVIVGFVVGILASIVGTLLLAA
jgi:hypothetical protein